MRTLETERLIVRPFVLEDAGFIVQLLNEPTFLEHIGDKGVRTLDQAAGYLAGGPLRSYRERGHGLGLVALRDSLQPIGMCGLLKRDGLDAVDLGYAFLPGFCGRGHAFEAAEAVLAWGRRDLGLDRVLAITSPGNARSIRLLERLGFSYSESLRLGQDAAPVALYVRDDRQAISKY